MKLILLPPFEALLNPAAKHIIEPLANLVPEPLQEFIDIKQDFEDLYNGILDDAIDSVVGHPSKAVPVPLTVTSTSTENKDEGPST